jgi:hypothetical protein
MIELAETNLSKFEGENLERMKNLAEKALFAFDYQKQNSLELERKIEREASKLENNGCFATVHLWKIDSKDDLMFHSYSPEYLLDLTSNYP